MRFSLSRHPGTPCEAIDRIDAVVEARGRRLRLGYHVQGRIGDLVIPERRAGRRMDELWRTTCLEAFAQPVPGEAYCEVNASPSTDWAAYQFDRYRDGMRALELEQAPVVDAEAEADLLRVEVALILPEVLVPGVWRLGLSAVIEERGGAKSYWALAHPPGRPDFHHADSFVVEMDGV
jgi:hypothetical protein